MGCVGGGIITMMGEQSPTPEQLLGHQEVEILGVLHRRDDVDAGRRCQCRHGKTRSQ